MHLTVFLFEDILAIIMKGSLVWWKAVSMEMEAPIY